MEHIAFLVFGDPGSNCVSWQCVLFFFYHMVTLSLFRESEDAALLLLKEIYDKLGVPFEQPQW